MLTKHILVKDSEVHLKRVSAFQFFCICSLSIFLIINENCVTLIGKELVMEAQQRAIKAGKTAKRSHPHLNNAAPLLFKQNYVKEI